MRTIPQRDLRNRSGEILRQAETGEQFTITVEGRPVAVLGPIQRRQWVPREEVLKLLRTHSADPGFFEEIQEMGGTLEELGDPWER